MKRQSIDVCLAVALGLGLVISTPAGARGPGMAVAAAVASPDRPAEDVARDPLRKPAALLAFAQIRAGERVADLVPGEGYFSRLLSKVVGPQGQVYAIVPSELAQVLPKAVDMAKAVAADPAFPNVEVLVQPTAAIKPPVPLDLAWTSDNYHDIYGFFGADQAERFDQAVFAALQPGGVFIVIDHAAEAGADPSSVKHLHRIDPAIVRAQVLAAGFRLEAESFVLANPADRHDEPIFAPDIRGRTDQFVLRFRKPR